MCYYNVGCFEVNNIYFEALKLVDSLGGFQINTGLNKELMYTKAKFGIERTNTCKRY